MIALLTVQDINLAAALASNGVEFYKPDPIRRITKDGKEICMFNFEPSKLGEQLCKLWGQKDLLEKQPEHPLSYCFAMMHNRERLLDLVKRSPAVSIVQKNGKIFFIPVNPVKQESQP